MAVFYLMTRDLRYENNITLNAAITYAKKNKKKLYVIFILTYEQLYNNKYLSEESKTFMIETLNDLNTKNHINIYRGNLKKILQILNEYKNDGSTGNVLFMSKDYTPYAKQREKRCRNIFRNRCYLYENNILLSAFSPLNSINISDDNNNKSNNDKSIFDEIKTKSTDKYIEKYSTFRNHIKKKYLISSKVDQLENVLKTKKYQHGAFNKLKYNKLNKYIYSKNSMQHVFLSKKFLSLPYLRKYNLENNKEYLKYFNQHQFIGSRSEALKRLRNIPTDYAKIRNDLSKETTRLSPYLKFGLLSPIEVYLYILEHLSGQNKTALIDQLIWREFYMYIIYYFDGKMVKPYKYSKSSQNMTAKKKQLFKLWTEGKTGVDIVDAGMRQLNLEGYMHNRARLITSNYLTATLNIDWKLGEKYFAQHLVDYDWSNNNGNWQWISGVGTDYMDRKFNPELQQKKYDKKKIYINRYLPIENKKNEKNK